MRRDLHIGLAIGGVLLAVLIVWGIVVSGSKKVSKVTLDTNGEKSSGSTGGDIPPPLTAGPTTPDNGTPVSPGVTAPTTLPTAPAAVAPKKDWSALIMGNATLDAQPVKTETPAPAGPPSTTVDPPPPALPPGLLATNTTPGSQTVPDPTSPSAPAPADPAPPVSTGGDTAPAVKTHTVQRGETFSSIAKAVYGDARYYQQIAKANPKIDPTKLRPGTVINLPDVASVKTSVKASAAASPSTQPAAAPSAAADAPAVDSQKEYRVASGDSLYKICMRLYGSGEEVDHLYDLNKATIGPDKARLKVGMILKIPAPPTVATASR